MAIAYGIIGTNWITTSWIAGAQKTGKWRLHAIYSRNQSTAQDFGAKHNCHRLYTSLTDLASDRELQVVYIASPNSLHFDQAKQMLRAKKHVIVEKPATSTVAELDELFRIAKEEGVYLMEAYRHIQQANFKILHRVINEEKRLGRIYGASFVCASRSSRYENVLAGEEPNVFSLEFSGGSLADIGVYPVALAVALFGRPKAQSYVPFVCKTGADGGGVGLLQYDGFGVQINSSKGYKSTAPCEIYGENGTITLDAIFDLTSITHWDPKTRESVELAGPSLEFEKPNVQMQEEIEEFARIIHEKDEDALAKLEEISRIMIDVTTDMRKQAGIVYPADKA